MPRILVVDDDPSTIVSFSGVLQSAGFAVLTAGTCSDALALAACERFDVILTDLRLPDRSGIDIIRELRTQRGCNTPFAIVTGFASTETALEAGRLGVAVYVEKPLIGDELLDAVHEALARRNPETVAPTVDVPPLAFDASRDTRVNAALAEIDRGFGTVTLTLASVARRLRVSASRLTTVLKRYTGRPFGAHLHARRVQMAAELLATTTLSVKEIAWRVGYKRTSELDRHFTRVFRVTPSAYRAVRAGRRTKTFGTD